MPIITLTTDFGASDHFAGAMKGVILGIAPKARIVDISHEITPYQILEAAFVIAQTWRHFPKKTVHVVVVDPGVGTSRLPIAVQAEGHFFLAPDNGVLSMILDSPHAARAISNPKFIAKHISQTFHGRDIFAPAAAHLANGAAFSRLGKPVKDPVRLPQLKPRRIARHDWSGIVLKTDRFGNLITNFHIDEFAEVKHRAFELRAGLERIHRLVSTFADAAPREFVAIVGSSGYLEIAMNQASAAQRLGSGSGSPLQLEIFYDSERF
jgi:S-adenosyl-L-methionine hydrolase (adenosine-forming)